MTYKGQWERFQALYNARFALMSHLYNESLNDIVDFRRRYREWRNAWEASA